MLIRRKLIRTRASKLLDTCCVTEPPVPVELIAQRLNMTVVRQPAEDELSGFLLRERQRGNVIIGVNDAHHPNRQRFTIAHEIGHFLLHEGEELHVDQTRTGYEIRLRYGPSSEDAHVDEKEANLFAAELLMPKHFLETDLAECGPLCLSDDEGVRRLASRYQVSAQALTVRLAYLGHITE